MKLCSGSLSRMDKIRFHSFGNHMNTMSVKFSYTTSTIWSTPWRSLVQANKIGTTVRCFALSSGNAPARQCSLVQRLVPRAAPQTTTRYARRWLCACGRGAGPRPRPSKRSPNCMSCCKKQQETLRTERDPGTEMDQSGERT